MFCFVLFLNLLPLSALFPNVYSRLLPDDHSLLITGKGEEEYKFDGGNKVR